MHGWEPVCCGGSERATNGNPGASVGRIVRGPMINFQRLRTHLLNQRVALAPSNGTPHTNTAH